MKNIYSIIIALAITSSFTLTAAFAGSAPTEGKGNPAITAPVIFASEASKEMLSDKNLQFKYYPNPTSKDLYIDIQFLQLNGGAKIEIKLISMIGKEMTTPYVVDVNSVSSHHYIDVADLPAGFYFMELVVTSNGTSSKFIRRITKTD